MDFGIDGPAYGDQLEAMVFPNLVCIVDGLHGVQDQLPQCVNQSTKRPKACMAQVSPFGIRYGRVGDHGVLASRVVRTHGD